MVKPLVNAPVNGILVDHLVNGQSQSQRYSPTDFFGVVIPFAGRACVGCQDGDRGLWLADLLLVHARSRLWTGVCQCVLPGLV